MVLPCAACKVKRRKCTEECIFAPYFPQNNLQMFMYVHKVYGASNVAKILNEVSVSQREETAKSLAFEAESRFKDPVYGCIGYISQLQQKLIDLEDEIFDAKMELASYIGPQAFHPNYLEGLSGSSSSSHVSLPFNHIQMNPFHNIKLSVSPSPQQLQPHHSFLPKRESENHGQGNKHQRYSI